MHISHDCDPRGTNSGLKQRLRAKISRPSWKKLQMSLNYRSFSSNSTKNEHISRDFDPHSTNSGLKANIQGSNEQRFRESTSRRYEFMVGSTSNTISYDYKKYKPYSWDHLFYFRNAFVPNQASCIPVFTLDSFFIF
jgi:hypothetical protein